MVLVTVGVFGGSLLILDVFLKPFLPGFDRALVFWLFEQFFFFGDRC